MGRNDFFSDRSSSGGLKRKLITALVLTCILIVLFAVIAIVLINDGKKNKNDKPGTTVVSTDDGTENNGKGTNAGNTENTSETGKITPGGQSTEEPSEPTQAPATTSTPEPTPTDTPAPIPTQTPIPTPTPRLLPTGVPEQTTQVKVRDGFPVAGFVQLKTETSELNVRSGPGTKYDIIGKLKLGEAVWLTDITATDNFYYWYKIEYEKDGKKVEGYVSCSYIVTAVVTPNPYATPTPTTTPKPVNEIPVIAIDAGHGGSDPGAQFGDAKEKDINLQIALKAEELLKEEGYVVYMTRSTDKTVGLDARIPLSYGANADLFISIHQNNYAGTSSRRVYGLETYYNPNRGAFIEKFATYLCEDITALTGTKNRGIKDGGENGSHLAVLCNVEYASLPAVLCEVGFMSDEKELENLCSDEYQQLVAQGIVNAVKRSLPIE